MGLVATQCRLLMLFDRKSRLELQMQKLSTQIMAAAARTSGISQQQSALLNKLTGNLSDSDKDKVNAQLEILQKSIDRINNWNTMIEQQQKQIDLQHNACQTEIETCQKTLDKNVTFGFKYFQQG